MRLLQGKKQSFFAAAALSAVVGILLAGPFVAQAEEKPPALSAAVRAALGMPSKEKAGAEGADGINLPGVNRAPAILSAEEELELQRQAEEVASEAAAEMERQEREYIEDSYKRASQGLLPLSTNQVRDFMQRLENTQESAYPPSTGAPKGEIRVVGLSLDPGGAPPQINLAAGYVTTIDIVDQTGEPWPILDVGVGGNFEVTPTQAGSHVVRVVPLTRVGKGNLSILLKDLSTPVIFRLSSGGSTFHMRYDARVPRLGPNAKTPLIEYRRAGPVAGEALISMILENAPPKEAKRLKIGGVNAQTKAWQVGQSVYVRTPLTLLSPAWNASASSADGMTVYEIGNAPVLLMSDNGAMVRARLMREDTHD
ncbi:MAG TPA: hypothetical protein DD400_06185 [Rhodospirillaceae bacterium]|nr:hypothetical protein [Rhodospirillaceae bacterium]